MWKRGVSSLAALLNPRRRVQSRQLNSCELDVTLMRSSDCGDGLRSWAWSRGNKEHKSLSTEPPYNMHRVGGERSLAGRVSLRSFSNRNVQPPSYEPEYPLLISQETRITVQSLQNTTSPANCVPCLIHWSTIPQVLPP